MHHDIIREYMSRVQKVYATGETTEHSFRPALQYLFDHITDDVECINEPKMVTDVGRPDFVFKRTVGHTQITVGHCEAKDIDKDVNPRSMRDANKDQHKRYIKGLPNLIYTNGLDFHFYKEGELVHEIRIADFAVGITPLPQRYVEFAQRLTEFTQERVQTITSSERLAELMAGKALLVKEALFQTLRLDPKLNSTLAGQFQAFKDQLIHDLTPEAFADLYAETVAYGLFAARLHDETLDDFSRQEALELLPKSNPFLRNLFSYVAGPNLEETIRRDIDELAEIFQATDLGKLFKNFGNFNQRNDPFIHFYEDFLSIYNPKKRKERGVWYTPEPVVNFIVRAVDDILMTEFGLPMGLADTSEIIVPVDTGQTRFVQRQRKGKKIGVSEPVVENRGMHRVQILDPATGTGTFLAEVIKQIAPKVKDVAPSKWSRYVEQNLLPRLHGFELLMASYAMCHMKLDMMLQSMDYAPTKNADRLSVYLTNSLEEGDKEVQDLFMAQWLSDEARLASSVKRDKPIMCIIGNPPYSGESVNKGNWIMGLMEAYKKEPGGILKLKERNPKWVNDDYIKFIRMSENLIEKNGEGILAFITNHGYLDNPTFRGVRWKLRDTFDEIKVIDLHGASERTSDDPEELTDANVFNIKVGVSIIIALKKKDRSDELASVKYKSVKGSRSKKYDWLWKESLDSITFSPAATIDPLHLFIDLNLEKATVYFNSFGVQDLFNQNSVSLVSGGDEFSFWRSRNDLQDFINAVLGKRDAEAKELISRLSDISSSAFKRLATDILKKDGRVAEVRYNMFDSHWTYFSGRSNGFLVRPRGKLAKHMIHENFALVFKRGDVDKRSAPSFITDRPAESRYWTRPNMNGIDYFAPLYLYPDEQDLDQTRRVNMDPDIRAAIEDAAEHPKHGRPDEVAIFDYIYGVLHCPAYRETYAEFLKIDFPRVPYPTSPESFWNIREKGKALRRLHLMDDAVIGETPYPYTGEAEPEKEDIVEKPKFEGDAIGKVLINKTQGFDNVPRLAWEFYIGGYQPAQKWLKDRKGRELSLDDIMHYQNIIKILSETDRIMKTIKMDLD